MHGWCRPWSCPVAPDPSTWRTARGPTARRRDRAKCSRPATVFATDQYADQATPIAAPRHRTSRMPDNVRLASRPGTRFDTRSEEHTYELQALMRTSYDVVCLKKKKSNH